MLYWGPFLCQLSLLQTCWNRCNRSVLVYWSLIPSSCLFCCLVFDERAHSAVSERHKRVVSQARCQPPYIGVLLQSIEWLTLCFNHAVRSHLRAIVVTLHAPFHREMASNQLCIPSLHRPLSGEPRYCEAAMIGSP